MGNPLTNTHTRTPKAHTPPAPCSSKHVPFPAPYLVRPGAFRFLIRQTDAQDIDTPSEQTAPSPPLTALPQQQDYPPPLPHLPPSKAPHVAAFPIKRFSLKPTATILLSLAILFNLPTPPPSLPSPNSYHTRPPPPYPPLATLPDTRVSPKTRQNTGKQKK